MPCEIPISTFETRLRICIIESRASRRERKLPTICLILRDENENLPRASKRDREFQSLYLKIRVKMEKMFTGGTINRQSQNLAWDTP